MKIRSLPLAALWLASVCLFTPGARAGGQSGPALRASISSDSSEVHPDTVFEVTLELQNLTGVTQNLRVPECAWDRLWKSSNRLVTWDAWDCEDNGETTIQIPPHGTYTFPQPIKMFVEDSVRKPRLDFRMGFKTRGFSRVVWSNTVSLKITP